MDQDVGHTLSCKLSGSDGDHLGPTTETVSKQPGVGVAAPSDRKMAK